MKTAIALTLLLAASTGFVENQPVHTHRANQHARSKAHQNNATE